MQHNFLKTDSAEDDNCFAQFSSAMGLSIEVKLRLLPFSLVLFIFDVKGHFVFSLVIFHFGVNAAIH